MQTSINLDAIDNHLKIKMHNTIIYSLFKIKLKKEI